MLKPDLILDEANIKLKLHQPVLLKAFLEYSTWNAPEVKLWDGTMGAAGHLIAWLKNNPQGTAFGSDQDAAMLKIAQDAVHKAGLEDAGILSRVTFAQGNFSENPFENLAPFDVILLDLGISSYHLDSLNRGISYRDTGLLDMRLDTRQGEPLYEWLKIASYEDIRNVIYKYGEESFAPIIAKKIVEQRATETMTPDWLNQICISAYARSNSKYVKNPGVKTFQAFRIFINRELDHLEKALTFIPDLLKPSGVFIVISFHSLEDRIVKHVFKSLEKIKNDSMYAKSEYRDGDHRILTKKAIVPDEDEVRMNPRSRSAKMRVLQRIC